MIGGRRISLQAVSDFMERIRKYEEVYEPIIDRNMHYIKLTDMVTGRGHLDINRISGYLPGKIVGFLLQVGKRQSIVYQQPPSIPVDHHFNMYTPAIHCTPITTQCYSLNSAAAARSQTTCILCNLYQRVGLNRALAPITPFAHKLLSHVWMMRIGSQFGTSAYGTSW